MKRILFVILVCLFSVALFAQDKATEVKLLEIIKEQRMKTLISFVPLYSDLERLSAGRIEVADSLLIKKMALLIQGDILMLKHELDKQNVRSLEQ